MEFFEKARTVRLRGHHGKYLWAEEDHYRISQNRETKNEQALWHVEKVPDSKLIRLISCYETYLTASDDVFLLGMTGKKVLQTRPHHIDSSVEWEPVKEGSLVKLKTCHGNFLRANAGLPPWRGSVTHDLPQRIPKHADYLLWDVENVSVPNIIPIEVPHLSPVYTPPREAHHAWVPHSPNMSPSPRVSHPKPDEGREIFYTLVDENGEAQSLDDDVWPSFKFKGVNINLLKKRLQAETQITEDIVICTRNAVNANLHPLRLALPPNNTPMHVVVVKASSSCTLHHPLHDSIGPSHSHHHQVPKTGILS